MKLRQKILVDRVIGLPAVFLLNGVCRLLGMVLNRNHSDAPKSVRTIAVAKFFGMGSIVQATPLLRSLHERFPDAKIVFVTSAQNRALMERLPLVDDAIYVDDAGPLRLLNSAIGALLALFRRRIDLYFDLEVYSAFSTLMALLCVARNRLGFYRYSTRFKEGIYTHLLYFNARLPIRRIYLQLGFAAGAHEPTDERIGPVRISDADRAGFAAAWSQAASGGADFTLINPNASDLLLERRWPAKHFVTLIQALVAKGHRIALSGAPSEATYVTSIIEALSPAARPSVVNMAGQLKLGEFFAMVEAARCVITNDTGPMHFAVALRRPTVCLFGPCSPDHYGFQNERVEIIYRQVFCSPCVHEIAEPPCAGNNICMQLIEPAMALAAAERLLSGASAPPSAPPMAEIETSDAAGAPLGLVVRSSIRALEGNSRS